MLNTRATLGTMLALLIVLATVALVIWSPRGFGPARAATLGAAVALLSGSVQLRDLSTIWGATWNATLTLVGLITLSLVLDAAGLFRWAALHVARAGGGHGRRLFVLLIVFAALLAAFFANDGGVLILTPIALELCAALKFEAAATLAFAFATGFVVDAASLPFTFSNLTNIVTADAFHLTFAGYAKIMLPVDLAVVAACAVVLLLYFARSLPRRYDLTKLDEPQSAIRSPGIFWLAWVLLPLLLVGSILAETLHLPLAALVGTVAAVLLIAAALSPQLSSRRILRNAPWNVIFFSLAMYTVVYGLRDAGITASFGQALKTVSGGSVPAAVFSAGGSVALLSAALNNLPALLFGLLGIQGSGVTGTLQQALVFGALVGADIGPKLTPIGSLATLLWLHVLQERGLKVSWGQYFRVGVVLTLPVLMVGLIALWAVLR